MWIKFNRNLLLGLVIILLAIGLRFYRLGQVPHGLTWDEAAIGYNGFAVVTTYRDEWLAKLPISFQSFGDYKAPLAIYVTGLFTVLLGMEVWVLRLPFAISSVLAIVGMMFLTKELFVSDKQAEKYALLAGLFLTISPWHLHFSRVGFESGMALAMIIWGSWWLVKFLNYKKESQSVKKIGWLWGAVLFLVAAIYTYHSSKIVVPLVVAFFLLRDWRYWWQNWKLSLGTGIFGSVLLIPFVIDVLRGEGSERFTQASLFGLHLPVGELFSRLIANFWAHFSPAFLIFGQTITLRHGDGVWGILYPSTLILIAAGLVLWLSYLLGRNKISKQDHHLMLLGSFWWLAGIIPAVIGRDVPHSNRALLALPALILLSVVSLKILVDFIKSWERQRHLFDSYGHQFIITKLVVGYFFLIEALCLVSYQHHYYTKFAAMSADDFKDGYQEAFQTIIPYELGLNGKSEVQKIIFTNQYGQPYIYALWNRKTSPYMYHGGSLIKYEFKEVNIGDMQRKNAVVVAAADDDIPTSAAQHLILGSDGQIKFKIYVLP